MKLASMTVAAFALAATAAAAQVPPTPPPPPPSVPVAPPPLVPAPAAVAPLPPVPIDLDVQIAAARAAAERAQAAVAAMPPLDPFQSTLFEAERSIVYAPFDKLDFARFEADLALNKMTWTGQATTVASRTRERESSYYDMGRSALDRRNWSDAINRFEQAIQLKGSRADAAMYWKAYAQSKNGQRAEALATISTLLQTYPQSRYLNDAKALEIQLKRGEVTPESQQDEDLKLLAIQGLQHSDPEQAIPLLEKILNSSNSPRVKERALYVLALSRSDRAQEILLGIAKGAGNPDLQRKAIDYLATASRRDGRSRLEEVYRSNNDQDVRMRVLRAYSSAGDRARLLAAAQNEPNEELRMAAIRYLGSSGAIIELGQLYDKETNRAIRMQIVSSLASAGALERLQQIARSEADPEIRMRAVRAFGSAGRERTGTILQDIYAKESSPEIKRAIISALHSQTNAEGLVAIARRETDPKLKEDIVRRLSTMTKSKVALDYLMEILNK